MAMTNQNVPSTQKAPDTKTTVRFLAGIVTVLAVLALFLPVNYFYGAMEVGNASAFKVFIDLLKSDTKFLKIFPALANASALGTSATLALYAYVLTLLAGIGLSVAAILYKEKSVCLLKTAVFVLTWGTAIYSLSIFIITAYLPCALTLDWVSCILAIAGAVLYFVLLYKEFNKKAILHALQFFCALGAVAAIFLAMTYNGVAVQASAQKGSTKAWLVVFSALSFISLALTTALVWKSSTKFAYVKFGNVVLLIGIALAVMIFSRQSVVASRAYLFFAILSVAISVGGLLLCLIEMNLLTKEDTKAAIQKAVEELDYEEVVEVYPYTGGAISELQVAEVVTPAAAPAKAEEEVADDPELDAFYAEKGTDEFIDTLSKAEKYEFAKLYILKQEKALADIPTYEIGACNKDFFKKAFIYISQYRDKISSSLLEKIYDYSQNN